MYEYYNTITDTPTYEQTCSQLLLLLLQVIAIIRIATSSRPVLTNRYSRPIITIATIIIDTTVTTYEHRPARSSYHYYNYYGDFTILSPTTISNKILNF